MSKWEVVQRSPLGSLKVKTGPWGKCRWAALAQVLLLSLQGLLSIGNMSEVALILRFCLKLGQNLVMIIFM